MNAQFAALVAASAPQYFLLRGIPVRFVGDFASLCVDIDAHVEIKPCETIMYGGKRFVVTEIRWLNRDEFRRIEFCKSML